MKGKKLNKAFDDFTALMKKRLTMKQNQGFCGWDDPQLGHDFLQSAVKKLIDPHSDQCDMADAANFAMFLSLNKERIRR